MWWERRLRQFIAAFLGCASLVIGQASLAAEAAPEESEDGAVKVLYVPLEPTLVTNFGASATGRPQYLRADLAVRVTGTDAQAAVVYHQAYLRNLMLLLLSRQDESVLTSKQGRDGLRQQALAQFQTFLTTEEGKPYAEDILFTNLLVQR